MKLHTQLELEPELVALLASNRPGIMQLPAYTAYVYDQVGLARTCHSLRFWNITWCENMACQEAGC